MHQPMNDLMYSFLSCFKEIYGALIFQVKTNLNRDRLIAHCQMIACTVDPCPSLKVSDL